MQNTIRGLANAISNLQQGQLNIQQEHASMHTMQESTVDSRYLEFQGDSLKHFEISVPRHIRVERVRKTINWTTHLTNEYVIWLLKLEIYI